MNSVTRYHLNTCAHKLFLILHCNVEFHLKRRLNTIQKTDLKLQLFKHCTEYIEKHIEIISHAVSEAQDAVHSESKNTAGDRYETERAMKQRETELFGKRIDEAMEQHQMLQMMDVSKHYNSVQPGSLVLTSIGPFFIAISTDEIVIEEVEYFVISIDSPIGQAMANKSAGESFTFRGKSIKISVVC
jgi:transcription elongation GreA/GreB family factor